MKKKISLPKGAAASVSEAKRCYDLAVNIGSIGCAIDEVRKAATYRDANGLLAPLHRIATDGKALSDHLGVAPELVRTLASRAARLRKAIESKGLHMKKLKDRDFRFLQEDASVMWGYVRQMEDAGSKSCGSRPPGMVFPVEPFRPIPKDLGK